MKHAQLRFLRFIGKSAKLHYTISFYLVNCSECWWEWSTCTCITRFNRFWILVNYAPFKCPGVTEERLKKKREFRREKLKGIKFFNSRGVNEGMRRVQLYTYRGPAGSSIFRMQCIYLRWSDWFSLDYVIIRVRGVKWIIIDSSRSSTHQSLHIFFSWPDSFPFVN